MLPYALSIFTGAFLLFQVQPLIGKFLLPWFGGSPGVWTTCLLFFQTALLGGYAYAHFSSTRLKPRSQANVHLVLLALSLAVLPITPSESWKAHLAGSPVGHILLLLTVTIGLPYFVLSSTGPLMQQWFSQAQPGVSPYRLYALSNLGSLLALLSYPFYFERAFSRHAQANLWSAGLGVFVLCCGYCAWRVRQAGEGRNTGELEVKDNEPGEAAAPSGWDRSLWLGLPAVASILLLAVTNKLCQEVAVIPFLWVVPLALYLLSFILCFDHPRWYRRGGCAALLMVGIATVCHALVTGNTVPLWLQLTGYTGTLFLACLICHGELYALRPPPRFLTSFYLSIAAGGAIGGFLVAIVAPRVFHDYWELQAGLWVLSYLLGVICFRQKSRALAVGVALGALAATLVVPALRTQIAESLGYWDELKGFYRVDGLWVAFGAVVFAGCLLTGRGRVAREWRPQAGGFVMAASVALGLILLVMIREDSDRTAISASRNFYGTLKVFEYRADEPESHYYLLMHGATTHGLQFANPPGSRWPTTYYAKTSGVGLALGLMPHAPEGRRIGLVGLGTGTLTSYGEKGDYLRVYDINPAVVQLARTRFTYLQDSPATIDVILGDARISMEREIAAGQSQQFDLLALDAFSSDAIPIHLLTREAVALYLRHLKPNGILAVHTSNRYLDLRPVVVNLAKEFDLGVAIISDDDEDQWWVYRTTWILVTKNRALLAMEDISKVTELPEKFPPAVGLWTDDHASLYEILRK